MSKYIEDGKFNSKKWISNNTVPKEKNLNEIEQLKKDLKRIEDKIDRLKNG